MEEFYKLIEILEHSVKRNGTIPLTNKHLLNICKMVVDTIEMRHSEEREVREDLEDDWGDRC